MVSNTYIGLERLHKMNRILLIEKPWVSKDGRILVGGHPLSTISFNPRHAKDLRKLINEGYLTISSNNDELCQTLLKHKICRPILDLPKRDVETISTQILLYFHVTEDIGSAKKSLTKLLSEESHFDLPQIVFSAETKEAWRKFTDLMHKSSLDIPLEMPHSTGAPSSEQYFVAFNRPVEISPLQVKLLLMELQESGSDLIMPRIIGSSTNIGSHYLSSAISHFEEHNFILDKGDKWATYESNDLRIDANLPLIAGKTKVLADFRAQEGAAPTGAAFRIAKTLVPKIKSQNLSLIYEPEIIARDYDSLTLRGFIKQSIEHGKQLGLQPMAENPEGIAKLRGTSLINLLSTLTLGKFGLALSTLTSALQVAYVSQKLVSQPYGNMAAVQFVYKSHIYTFKELNNKLRESIALPIAILMPFSKIARRIGIGLVLLRIAEISQSSDKEELPANLILACIQDTCISGGLWMAAASRKSILTAMPNVKLTKWRSKSKPLFQKMESQQPTSETVQLR